MPQVMKTERMERRWQRAADGGLKVAPQKSSCRSGQPGCPGNTSASGSWVGQVLVQHVEQGGCQAHGAAAGARFGLANREVHAVRRFILVGT